MKRLVKIIAFSAVSLSVLNAGFVNYGSTVKDTTKNIEWQDTSEVKYNKRDYYDAKSYCSNLYLNGKSDWRLPTIYELFSIVDYSVRKPAIKREFKHVNEWEFYWSETKRLPAKGSPVEAWGVDFWSGSVKYKKFSGNAKTYVRCVRGGSYSSNYDNNYNSNYNKSYNNSNSTNYKYLVTVRQSALVCTDLYSYKRLVDAAINKSKEIPEACRLTKRSYKFGETGNTTKYRNINIHKLVQSDGTFVYAWDKYISR
jgi:hypothetical protein